MAAMWWLQPGDGVGMQLKGLGSWVQGGSATIVMNGTATTNATGVYMARGSTWTQRGDFLLTQSSARIYYGTSRDPDPSSSPQAQAFTITSFVFFSRW
jgi:hypothetical protein